MYVEKAYNTVDSDSSVVGALQEEQAMSWHRVSPSPFLSLSPHTTQLHYTNSYTYNHPNLNFLLYTIQILVPHVMWSAQAVCDSKTDHTKPFIRLARNAKRVIVQWVGIGTHTIQSILEWMVRFHGVMRNALWIAFIYTMYWILPHGKLYIWKEVNFTAPWLIQDVCFGHTSSNPSLCLMQNKLIPSPIRFKSALGTVGPCKNQQI